MPEAYVYPIEVAASAIDANGHANNVEFVRWMQEAAVSHSDTCGGSEATRAAGATWVIHSHRIDYLKPAFAGDQVEVRTWVADFRRAFSLRRYEFVRTGDGTLLARGETDWVFVDAASGRPRTVPGPIRAMFGVGTGPDDEVVTP
jgi:acyl-CoA thioester hydrolase